MIGVMQDVNIQSDSSRHASSKTLAPKTLLAALRDFINTGNEPKRIAYFLKRWPEFLEPAIQTDAERLCRSTANNPLLRVAMFEVAPEASTFQKLRAWARLAWKGEEAVIYSLLHLGFEDATTNLIYVDWRRGGFRYEPRTAFQAAVYELLRHSRQARVCANPDCANPYFLTSDPRRKFCSVECTQPAQKQWRRTWWEQHGKEWRKKRAKKSTKGRKPHGNN